MAVITQNPSPLQVSEPNYTLGIHDGHNAAAALLRNGEVIAATQEERFTRVKNQGGLPHHSVADVLRQGGISLDQVNQIALDGRYMTYAWSREEIMSSYGAARGSWNTIKRALRRNDFVIERYMANKQAARLTLMEQAGWPRAKLNSVEHHTAHASAAYYGSGMSGKVLVLTCDGNGDRLCASVSIGENGKLTRIAEIEDDNSIGRVYAMVTYQMGMVPLEHEYKLMGLAPYVGDEKKAAQYSKLFANLFEFNPRQPMVWRRRTGVPSMYAAQDLIAQILNGRRFDYVAAGLQYFVEQHLTTWIRNCIRETGIRRIALSGGVFMNVKANKCILDMPEVEEVFVFPSCGDETNSMGAAWNLLAQQGQTTQPIGQICLGDSFDDAQVESALNNFKTENKFVVEQPVDIEKNIAETLANGEVVARCRGRMEFGARGLGNRSILARPDRQDAVRVINDMIKSRDFWMPFAPSVLAERADDYYIKPKPIKAPYMIFAFDSRPEKRAAYPAAQHPYDHTARPQEVYANWNPDYHRMLKYYEEITGEGIILNTSFNLHGFPVVRLPHEALEVLDRSGLKYLALGNFWIRKQ